MELLRTIRDEDIGSNIVASSSQQERRASRAVVFDAEKRVALLHATKKNFHKLPGGGIEEGESISAALEREVSEEIGCAVSNVRELGTIEEYRNKFSLHQISYCFLADLLGDKGTPHLMEDEIADGFETVWMDLATAIKTIESEAPVEDYEGKFIQLRDLTFLQEAMRSNA